MSEIILLGLDEPFYSRYEKLRSGSLRIAYYYDYPDDSTFRYRISNMIEVLDAQSQESRGMRNISASWFCFRDAQKLDLVVDNCDIIVFVRARYSGPVANAICKAQIKGRKIYYDIDDFVVDIDLVPMIVSCLDQDTNNDKIWEYWFQYVSRLRAILIECDEIIATNEALGQSVKELYGKSFSVIPNFYNTAQATISSSVRISKLNRPQEKTHFSVGYFSGSPSHNKDFDIASSALLNMLNKYTNSRLVIAGYLELSDKFKEFEDRVDKLPIMNFGPLQREISKVSLNISPLQHNSFTVCKSELKFFEAALVLTPTLASQVGTFATSISNRENGWLAMPQDWSHLIEEIIENHALNKDYYDSVSNSALATAERKFSYAVMYDTIKQVFQPS